MENNAADKQKQLVYVICAWLGYGQRIHIASAGV